MKKTINTTKLHTNNNTIAEVGSIFGTTPQNLPNANFFLSATKETCNNTYYSQL